MKKIRLTAVSYLNTLPFLYGIKHSKVLNEIDFVQDIPSQCAQRLIDNQTDISLMPVAAIPMVRNAHIISDYCIGAVGKVKTVLLLSDVPLNEIKTIFLDYQSKTSVNLVKILASKYWNIKPKWIEAKRGYESEIKSKKAGVVIGDRTFSLANRFKYVYDLAEEWQKYKGLPFVFAAWVANKEIDNELINMLNEALLFGLKNIESVVTEYKISFPESKIDLQEYFTNYISYEFDEKKKIALQVFFDELSALGLLEQAVLNMKLL